MRTQSSSQKKPMNMARIIKTPVRAISKVLDLYVKGVTSFSYAYNKPLRYTVEVNRTSQQLPRSFTTGSIPDKDQPPEGAFVRSISTGTICNKAANVKINDLQLYMTQQQGQQVELSVCRKSRSCALAMGKIDEDRVSSFRNDNIVLKSKLPSINDADDSVFSKKQNDDRVSTKRIKFI